MVVLYGGLLLISVYLTYMTGKSREKSREIKRLKLVSKEYRLEIASLKAKINHGKAETERTEAKQTSGSSTTNGNWEPNKSPSSNSGWWKTVRQSF